MTKSKFNNNKIIIDEIKFDSKKEAQRYLVLKEMLEQDLIKDLALQPKFILQDKFKHNGKTHRKIEYVADFSYTRVEDDKYIIEDVKGFKTREFRMKEKLLLKTLVDKGIAFEFNLI